MRWALALLLLIAVGLAPVGALARALAESEADARGATVRSGTTITWPADSRVAAPDWALRVLREIAAHTHTTVARLVVTTGRDGRTRYTHYVLLERTDSRMLDTLTLEDGRWITPEESARGTAITATTPVGALPVVGTPAVLGHAYDLTVAPLSLLVDRFPVAGRYTIDVPTGEGDLEFRSALVQAFHDRGLTELTVSDLTADNATDTTVATAHPATALRFLPLPFAALAALVSGALLLRSGKTIGVMRLFGLPGTRIWFRIVGRTQCVVAAIGVLGWAVGIAILPGSDAALAARALGTVAAIAAIAVLTSAAVGTLVFRRLRVSGLLTGVLS